MNGYWNGEHVEIRLVYLTLGDNPAAPAYWARMRGLLGQRWKAVEVHYGGETFYLDDHDGEGLFKVTQGRGSPRYSHRSVYPQPGTNIEDREQNPPEGFQQ